jgi:hypothetical protein
VVGASLWNMWNGEMFPAEKDPTGGMHVIGFVHVGPAMLTLLADPETWTETELRRWLKAVSIQSEAGLTRPRLTEVSSAISRQGAR